MKILKLTIFILSFFLLANNVEAANSSEFTMTISLKASNSVATKAIVSKADEMRIVTDASDHPSCQIFPGGGSPRQSVVSSKAIKINTWSRVACTYNQKYLKIFINGKETGSRALTVSVDDTSNALKIGVDDSAGVGYGNLAGLVDDFRFYSYALNEEGIKKDYNSGKATVMGSASTASDGVTKTNAKNRDYCVPGDTATCNPPVLELKMDEKSGSTVYDTSGNGNNGTINGASWGRGKHGSALEFDDTQTNNVEVNTSTLTNDFSAMTINMWVKFNHIGADNSYRLLTKRRSGFGGWEFYKERNTSSAVLTFHFSNNDGTNFSIDSSNKWPSSDVDKTWHNIVVSYDGSYLNLYDNGISIATPVIATGTIDNQTHKICVATIWTGSECSNTSNDSIEGSIDDVRIYNYARTPAQIAWDYNHGKPVAEWRFDECAGSTIHDESGNGNHGTLHLGTHVVIATGTCSNSSSSFWYNGRSGKYNSSGSFDGYDDRIILENDVFDYLSEGTFGAWVKWDASNHWEEIFGVGSTTDWFEISMSDYNKFSVYTGSGCAEGVQPSVEVKNPTEWHYVVYSSSKNQGNSMYVDGEKTIPVYSSGDSSSHAFLSSCSTGGITEYNIGAVMNSSGAGIEYFKGQIDEVKIWNYVLTAEQIKSEYNSGAVKFGDVQ